LVRSARVGSAIVQTAFSILRLCTVSRIVHLLRVLPPTTILSALTTLDTALEKAATSLLQLHVTGKYTARRLPRLLKMPVRLGGMGLQHPVTVSTAAYLGCWAGVGPEVVRVLVDQGVGEAAALFPPTDMQDEFNKCRGLDFWSSNGIKSAADLFVAAEEPRRWYQRKLYNILRDEAMENLLADSHAGCTPEVVTAIKSAAAPRAGAWLTTLPSSPLLRLQDAHFIIASKLRLGVPVITRAAVVGEGDGGAGAGAGVGGASGGVKQLKCSHCRKVLAWDGREGFEVTNHALMCQGMHASRHKEVKFALSGALRTSGVNVEGVEPIPNEHFHARPVVAKGKRTVQDERKRVQDRRGDLLVHPVTGTGRRAMVDLVITHPSTIAGRPAKAGGESAEASEQGKVIDYKRDFDLDSSPNCEFIPFGLETLGAWGPAAYEFVRATGVGLFGDNGTAAKVKLSKFTRNISVLISVALQQAVAKQLQRFGAAALQQQADTVVAAA